MKILRAVYRTIRLAVDCLISLFSLLLAVTVSLTIGLGLALVLGTVPCSEQLVGLDTTVSSASITLAVSNDYLTFPQAIGGLCLVGSGWGIIDILKSKRQDD